MSRTEKELTDGLDSDFQKVAESLRGIFINAATKFHGRATHTYGAGARGVARMCVPIGFPKNDFFKAGKTFPIILRHSSPGGQEDDRTRDGSAASIKFYENAADPKQLGFHDIMMNTGRALFVRTARAFFTMVTTPNPDRIEKLLKPGILIDPILAEGYRNGGSFTDFYYHSQICYEFTDASGTMRYLRYRLINGDRGPERGIYPPDWKPNGITWYPKLDDDARAHDFKRQDFLHRVTHGGLNYLLQGQLRPGNDSEAVNCSGIWDSQRYPWVDLAELRLDSVLTLDDLDALELDANRTHPCIALPLATSGLWSGLQADNHASLGHARALVYWAARKARADAQKPHVN